MWPALQRSFVTHGAREEGTRRSGPHLEAPGLVRTQKEPRGLERLLWFPWGGTGEAGFGWVVGIMPVGLRILRLS